MRTLCLTIAYDGTDFAGFQVQVGRRTVQGTLEYAVARVTGEKIRVDGAGRTDAGVHASGQIVSFRTGSAVDVTRLRRGIEAVLPDDVAVVEVREADPSFHARFSARGRYYRYTIWNAPEESVFQRRFAYNWHSPLDDVAMSAAARDLVGRHNFAAFCGTLRGRNRTTEMHRTLFRLHCWRSGETVIVDAAADSFLPHMVRNLVGTLLQVGTRNLDISSVRGILAGRNRQVAGVATAPARGLCLTRVWYD